MVGVFSELPGPKHINTSQSPLEKLKRIDFRGAFLLTTTVLSICLILDLGGSRIPWTSHWITVLIGTAAACSVSYVIFARSTPEPIFPIQLATQPVVFKHYLLILSQAIAFNALMVYVPVYFQVVSLASTSEAGMFLVPAFLGNTLGGLFAGAYIRRSKRFKPLNLGALASGLLSMISLWIFWNGKSSPWLALLTFPLGFGMGALFNSVFVGLATQVQEQDVAMATSGLFLFFNLGAVAGVSGGSAVFHSALREWLGRLLSGVDGASEVCLRHILTKELSALSNTQLQIRKRALTDIAYVQGAPDAIRSLLVPSYVAAFHSVLGMSSLSSRALRRIANSPSHSS
jgi:MFS family permease